MGSVRGEVLRFDGKNWIETATLPNGVYNFFGFSDRDVFAAGGFVFHYNGREWTEESVAPGGGGVTAIWGASPNELLGVGYRGTVARRVNGRWEWGDSPTTRSLHAMWGSSSREIFAVGDLGRIIEYDGELWHNVESNTDWSLSDIWGRSRSDIYAVGQGTITHFDGESWTPLRDVPAEAFNAVWGDNNATYFVTLQGSIYERRDAGLKSVFHSPNLYLAAIAGSDRTGLIAGGSNGITVIRERSNWRSTEQDAQTQYESASMGNDGTLFVAGYGPTGGFVRSRQEQEPWAERAAPTEGVEKIWAADHDHAFGMRYDNILHRLVGSTWDQIPAPGFENAQQLFGFGQINVVIAEDSLVGWFDGTNWSTNSVGTGVRVMDIWGLAPDNLWVVSYDGRVYAWNGLSWILMSQFDSAVAISGTSSQDVWVAESWLILHHYDGHEWTETRVNYEPGYFTRPQLLAIASNDVFMIGHGSKVQRFDGSGWSTESTPPCAFLSCIAGAPDVGVTVVGDNGALLHLDR